MSAQDLTRELVDQYGDLLPPTLIDSTVQAAGLTRRPDTDPEQAAREDVAALADAALRHTNALAS